MTLMGELGSFVVSWAQEASIIAGVGALTITLVGHLLSLHARQNEVVHGYVRMAHQLRALALIVVIISGVAAILLHVDEGTLDVLLAPAYLFKWLLIVLLTVFHFLEWKVVGWKQDAVEGFEGANWYALLLVHTLAPATGWVTIGSLYGGWLVAFGAIWAAFVWFMRRQNTLPVATKPAEGPVPVPPPAPKPIQPAAPEPKPIPPPPPKPIPPPVPVVAPVPVAEKKIEIHPNHSLLPMVAELDLPAPSRAEEPAAKVELTSENLEEKTDTVPNLAIDHTHLPAIHTMPKRPEDISASKRGPVVKMGEE